MFIVGLLLLTILTLSCKQASGPMDQFVSDLIPLAVGNQWTFQRSYYDSLGNVVAVYPPESLLIKADTSIDGHRWFYHRYLGHLLAYRNSEIGTLIRLVSPNTDGKVFVAYKQPTRTGEIYGFPVVFFSGNNAWITDSVYIASVVSVDTLVSVPAGTFRCYQFRVTRQGSDGWWDEFLARHYGWIRKDFYSRFRPGGAIYRVNSQQTINITIR